MWYRSRDEWALKNEVIALRRAVEDNERRRQEEAAPFMQRWREAYGDWEFRHRKALAEGNQEEAKRLEKEQDVLWAMVGRTRLRPELAAKK